VSAPANDAERVLMTVEGYEQRCRELDRLQNEERHRLGELLREARRDGDIDDNPALADLLDERAQLERRIATLKAHLAEVEVAAPPTDGRVGIGSVVRVRDVAAGDVFECELVGPLEGDVTSGRISTLSPIGRALIGKSRGARVEVAAPRGPLALKVITVRRPAHALSTNGAGGRKAAE
jgi:transcription elongation factor GreA